MIEIPNSKSQIPNKSQTPNSKPYNLRERLFQFSKRVLQITARLPHGLEYDVIRKQLSKSGTSIGANFEEADGCLTKKDFINKVGIARKEAKESKYWLKLISETLNPSDFSADIAEAQEIINILSSILKPK